MQIHENHPRLHSAFMHTRRPLQRGWIFGVAVTSKDWPPIVRLLVENGDCSKQRTNGGRSAMTPTLLRHQHHDEHHRNLTLIGGKMSSLGVPTRNGQIRKAKRGGDRRLDLPEGVVLKHRLQWPRYQSSDQVRWHPLLPENDEYMQTRKLHETMSIPLLWCADNVST